jgi:2-hydroxychromene-2-carboxylate isomerase
MPTAPIRFYFDFISPYAYLAWTQIHSLAQRQNRALELVPVLFAALLDAHGQKGPAEIAAKRIYVFKDALRTAHVLGLPALRAPPSHPFNPLFALRAASLPLAPAEQHALVDALFHATWAAGTGVDSAERVAMAATSAGLDGTTIVAQVASEVAKTRLRQQTDAAIAAGVFGVPTMSMNDELFWGYDSLPHLERYLRGEDPVTTSALANWNTIAASAVRPRSR